MDPLTSCYAKNPNFIPRKIAGEHILVPLKRTPGQPDALFVLNATGGFIWDQLSDATPAAAVRDRLVAQFDVSVEQAERDLSDVLGQLSSIGAIAPAA